MPVVSPPSTLIAFGIFELDPERWELRRRGVLLGLQAQPCRLLHLLASQPGRVVSREAIREYLWPGDKADTLDARINFCLAQIREALDDDASNPRFVQTVRGRGYSFVAPVREPAAMEAAANAAQPAAPAAAGKTRHWPQLWQMTAGAGLALVAGLGLWLGLRGAGGAGAALQVQGSAILNDSRNVVQGGIYAAGGNIFSRR